jgi:hypothetical protein
MAFVPWRASTVVGTCDPPESYRHQAVRYLVGVCDGRNSNELRPCCKSDAPSPVPANRLVGPGSAKTEPCRSVCAMMDTSLRVARNKGVPSDALH